MQNILPSQYVNIIDPETGQPVQTRVLGLSQAIDAKRALMMKLDLGQFDANQWLRVILSLEASGFPAMAGALRLRRNHYMGVLLG
jgi:hypothetical protein